MQFIRIKVSDDLEEFINVEYIVELIKGVDYDESNKIFFNSYSIIMKNQAPKKITEFVYNQIIEKLNLLEIKGGANER